LIAHIRVSPSINLKLISRNLFSKYSNGPTYVITVPERHGQTDRQFIDGDRRHTVA